MTPLKLSSTLTKNDHSLNFCEPGRNPRSPLFIFATIEWFNDLGTLWNHVYSIWNALFRWTHILKIAHVSNALFRWTQVLKITHVSIPQQGKLSQKSSTTEQIWIPTNSLWEESETGSGKLSDCVRWVNETRGHGKTHIWSSRKPNMHINSNRSFYSHLNMYRIRNSWPIIRPNHNPECHKCSEQLKFSTSSNFFVWFQWNKQTKSSRTKTKHSQQSAASFYVCSVCVKNIGDVSDNV